jgi:1,4-alpha-glucan branching enzyme
MRHNGAGKKVEFKLAAKPGSRVYVAGTFNAWHPHLHRLQPNGHKGEHVRKLVLAAGRHEYRFIVDEVWQNDPLNPHSVPNAYGTTNNVLEVA